MGLDQNFSIHRAIRNYDYLPDEERETVVILRNGEAVPSSEFDSTKADYIQLSAGYLRKANQIHNWIDNRVEGGVHNCQPAVLVRADIQALLDTINKVLSKSVLVSAKICVGHSYSDGKATPMMEDGQTIADPLTAQKLLPTTSGFFFGSQGYDQFYIDDLHNAKRIMVDILADESVEEVLYDAWW